MLMNQNQALVSLENDPDYRKNEDSTSSSTSPSSFLPSTSQLKGLATGVAVIAFGGAAGVYGFRRKRQQLLREFNKSTGAPAPVGLGDNTISARGRGSCMTAVVDHQVPGVLASPNCYGASGNQLQGCVKKQEAQHLQQGGHLPSSTSSVADGTRTAGTGNLARAGKLPPYLNDDFDDDCDSMLFPALNHSVEHKFLNKRPLHRPLRPEDIRVSSVLTPGEVAFLFLAPATLLGGCFGLTALTFGYITGARTFDEFRREWKFAMSYDVTKAV
ncbi:unnamed protein product [Amoebophrya sp. A25]|nr:unnamed protein product [Amoebophrya sp. A25]|eukprot:GSA25T00026262001.1